MSGCCGAATGASGWLRLGQVLTSTATQCVSATGYTTITGVSTLPAGFTFPSKSDVQVWVAPDSKASIVDYQVRLSVLYSLAEDAEALVLTFRPRAQVRRRTI